MCHTAVGNCRSDIILALDHAHVLADVSDWSVIWSLPVLMDTSSQSDRRCDFIRAWSNHVSSCCRGCLLAAGMILCLQQDQPNVSAILQWQHLRGHETSLQKVILDSGMSQALIPVLQPDKCKHEDLHEIHSFFRSCRCTTQRSNTRVLVGFL